MAAWYASAKEPPMRIVPAMEAVEDDPDLPPEEDLREVLKAKESIAIGLCPCRRQSSAHRDNRDLEVCFLFDRWATAGVERGALRRITLEEALQAASLAEENGLVHTLGPAAMCSCTTDYCVMAVPLIQNDMRVSKAWAKSAYGSLIDQGECSGCQDCVEWCPADAIDMVKTRGSKKLKASVDLQKCIGCGVCLIKCDDGAITLQRDLAQALLDELG
jgi:Pyruvate/2-oxoacid:ferredoxin oxidoreductase delta subunit